MNDDEPVDLDAMAVLLFIVGLSIGVVVGVTLAVVMR